MQTENFQKAIQLQFNTLVKRVVDTTVKDYHRELSCRSKHELAFSDISDFVIEQTASLDTYECEYFCFDVLGEKVFIANEKLGQALNKITKRSCLVILMFYFLRMTDTEISKALRMDRTTALRTRKRALEELKRKY